MDEIEIITTAEFVSKGYGEKRRRTVPPKKPTRKKAGGGRAYLLVRLGVCAAAFCGVLGLKLAGNDEAIRVIGELTQEQEERQSDTLGKLKFVELPSIIEVFAPSDKLVLPVSALGFELADDGATLTILTAYGSDIISPVDGSIRAVGTDEVLGRYVSVAADGDAEFTVYGFDDISVEQGQPVKKRQKLGSALGASVSVRAWKSGRPVSVEDVFGLGSAS